MLLNDFLYHGINQYYLYCLLFKSIFTEAVRKNRLCTLATESEIGNITKEWFRYAADREGGRKLREERKRAREAAVEQTTDDEDHGS